MEVSQIIALASSVIGALSLLLAFVVFLGNRHKSSNEEVMRNQLVNDKLDRNNEMARETRDTVRDMSRKLDDHAQTLVRHTEQIATLFKRVERIERGCDARDKADE